MFELGEHKQIYNCNVQSSYKISKYYLFIFSLISVRSVDPITTDHYFAQ